MSEEKMLEECRAVWESTKPDAVFADFWLGWKASRESVVIELPDRYDWTAEQVGIFKDDEGTLFDADAVVEAIEAAGLKVKA